MAQGYVGFKALGDRYRRKDSRLIAAELVPAEQT
jgi:hypothetical protein